jgi:hypothetical protein
MIKEISFAPNYFVSTEGKIFSRNHAKTKELKEMKLTTQSNGYLTVRLSRNYGIHYVHRLIAISFIPNPDNKPTVNHKNSNKADNCVSNLEWATYQENHRHSFNNGRKAACGEKAAKSKVTEIDVKNIRNSYIPRIVTYMDLAIKFNLSWWQIRSIIKRKHWKHI